ncbi:hypothetical protein KI809_02290 [Geobacter pelophilus]|uniref:Uncharacterized protein n=1 Tax=Geoanaerobacter pelophilus TaxID=60036 RepID=A0AAW4KX47_9BACT|nr:hypothetical protein [Geoanaerobacter pelophilus]MBT0663118.1 hypothetical protein [Geoanaerobacter pelophilus]
MKITISNDKASATVICRDLILDDSVPGARNLFYLTAYGPTQEIRAFAQILAIKGSLECHGKEDRSTNIWSNHPLRVIPKMGEGYSGAYITPSSDSSFLIGTSKADCYQVFTRILDQREFVHRDWYETLFNEVSMEIEPLVGNKRCWKFRTHELKSEIVNRLKYGGLKMPPATAHFTIEKEERHALSN